MTVTTSNYIYRGCCFNNDMHIARNKRSMRVQSAQFTIAFSVRLADAFTNEQIKWLHNIAKNRICSRFIFQLIGTAIPISVSFSLCVRTRLMFKLMTTALLNTFRPRKDWAPLF